MCERNRRRLPALICQCLFSVLVVLSTGLASHSASGQTPAAKPLPDKDPPTNKAPAPRSSYTLNTAELKFQYRYQRDKQTGVVSVASAVTSPPSIVIAWDPTLGPVPENPLLVQITFNLNINNAKIPATYTTTVPVAAQGAQWSVDVTDVVKRLVDDINSTLSPVFDPNTIAFPLDKTATVKVIQVLKGAPQFGPVAINKGPSADVNNNTITITPVLTLGETQ